MASSFLTAYYTDTVGLAALAVGTMMLVARIFDGVTDLVMGAIVDKTKSKYGKARPWVLWTAPFMCIGLIAMFSVPQGLSQSQGLIYAYISYIFMNCIVYTANNLPYNALLSRMTHNHLDDAVDYRQPEPTQCHHQIRGNRADNHRSDLRHDKPQ